MLVATAFESTVAGAALPALLGIASAALLGGLLYAGVVRLDLRRFFGVSGLVLLVFAAGMVGLGVHELIEAAIVPAIVNPLWDINAVLSDSSPVGELLKGLFGYHANPALTEVLAYVTYVAVIGWAFLRARRPAPAHS